MLFILYGATLEWGWRSREFFQKEGFEVIQKFNYVEDESPVDSSQYRSMSGEFSRWYNDKVYVTKEEYSHCDFRYQLNGVHVGFNQEQILNAVRGVTDGIITLAASSLDFIQQLKTAYGDYITVIYLCASKDAVRADYENPAFTPEERTARLEADQIIRRLYLDYYDMFDQIVPYTGEGSVFNEASVYRMFRSIISKRRQLEHALNAKNYVELPYLGKEPYIFVSYSHNDRERVYPILCSLQTSGYRIWYDDGIPGGENWRRIIALKIEGCTDFILFSSESASQSDDISAELNCRDICNRQRSKETEIRIITVRLDDAYMRLEDEMYLSRRHMLRARDPSFLNKLEAALGSVTKG